MDQRLPGIDTLCDDEAHNSFVLERIKEKALMQDVCRKGAFAISLCAVPATLGFSLDFGLVHLNRQRQTSQMKVQEFAQEAQSIGLVAALTLMLALASKQGFLRRINRIADYSAEKLMDGLSTLTWEHKPGDKPS